MTKAQAIIQAMEATGTRFEDTTPEQYAKRHNWEECRRFIAWLYEHQAWLQAHK